MRSVIFEWWVADEIKGSSMTDPESLKAAG